MIPVILQINMFLVLCEDYLDLDLDLDLQMDVKRQHEKQDFLNITHYQIVNEVFSQIVFLFFFLLYNLDYQAFQYNF